jgi:hypothetical protein
MVWPWGPLKWVLRSRALAVVDRDDSDSRTAQRTRPDWVVAVVFMTWLLERG